MRLHLLSSPPFEEHFNTECMIGCNAAIHALHERDLAALDVTDFETVYDLGAELDAVLADLCAKGGASFIGEDHVHPVEEGHHVIARLLLAMQGADVQKPTAEMIMKGEVTLCTLSEINRRKHDAEQFLRDIGYVDFNIFWGQEHMTLEEKCAFWRVEENFAEMHRRGIFSEVRARSYAERKPQEDAKIKEVIRLSHEMYE